MNWETKNPLKKKKRAMSLNTNHCCTSTPQTALIHAPTDQEKHAQDSIKNNPTTENDCMVV